MNHFHLDRRCSSDVESAFGKTINGIVDPNKLVGLDFSHEVGLFRRLVMQSKRKDSAKTKLTSQSQLHDKKSVSSKKVSYTLLYLKLFLVSGWNKGSENVSPIMRLFRKPTCL